MNIFKILKKHHQIMMLGVFIITILFSGLVYGRAGGGRSFSGGSSFGGSSFGHSSSFGRSGYYSRGIGINDVIIFIIIIAVVIYRAKYEIQEGRPGRIIQKANRMQNESIRNRGISIIKNKDPGFDESIFINRVKTAFLKIQDAWCAHDLSTVRPFISDGIDERFTLQIEEQKAQNIIDEMESIVVNSVRIAQVYSDNVFDTITVRVDATAVDYSKDINTGKIVDGTKSSSQFVEYWSFLRKLGVKSSRDGGLIEGNCPNCGAQLNINQFAKCESCDSMIKNGSYDWVLAEITQASEWSPIDEQSLPGVESLQNRDNNFSVQALEDNISVMFYRQMTSWRNGKLDALQKIATESYCQEFSKKLSFGNDGTRTFPGQAAIGKVDTLGIYSDGDIDTAMCLIRWSASRFIIDRSGKIKKAKGATLSSQVFFVVRKNTAKTFDGENLGSTHCPSCGSPGSTNTASKCEYCGAIIKSEESWRLDDVQSLLSPKVSEMKSKLSINNNGYVAKDVNTVGTPGECISGGAEAAAWMIQIMLADGVIDKRERELIDSYAKARGVSLEQIDMLIEAMGSGELEAPKPNSEQEARQWIEAMAAMALADGIVDKSEKKALLQLGKKLNYSAYDIKMILAKKRGELYQNAKKRIIKERKMKMKSFDG